MHRCFLCITKIVCQFSAEATITTLQLGCLEESGI